MKQEKQKKKIDKIKIRINVIEKDLFESELDYTYLSTPKNLSIRLENLSLTSYEPMDYSKIYLDYNDFINSNKNISNIKKEYEKKIKNK